VAVYELDGIRPDIPDDRSVWIAPGAHVIGKVRLKPGASIWFGAVLRGDNEWIEIGPDTNIQEHALLHTDIGFPLTIGANCTIGHGAILHGCTIADDSLVGMGATVLNGAVIGAGCLVGAGALVTERKSFPAQSLIVGSPAVATKTLGDAVLDRLKLSGKAYAANAKRFSKGMRLINPEG
jgi:carbonic anhydrase/acetyltransferase-like protein (isoleucine patch superfamily)